jgi:hypothetical protein
MMVSIFFDFSMRLGGDSGREWLGTTRGRSAKDTRPPRRQKMAFFAHFPETLHQNLA